jgi:hypothetical protein
MLMPFTHYAADTAVISTEATITAGSSGTTTGYNTGGEALAASFGSIADGPLLSTAGTVGVFWSSAAGGRMVVEFDAEVSDALDANFTKVTIDGTDYLFSAEDFGGPGIELNGNTILQYSGIGANPFTVSSDYAVQLF